MDAILILTLRTEEKIYFSSNVCGWENPIEYIRNKKADRKTVDIEVRKWERYISKNAIREYEIMYIDKKSYYFYFLKQNKSDQKILLEAEKNRKLRTNQEMTIKYAKNILFKKWKKWKIK